MFLLRHRIDSIRANANNTLTGLVLGKGIPGRAGVVMARTDELEDDPQRAVAQLRAEAKSAERVGDLKRKRLLEAQARTAELALRSRQAGFQ